MNYSNIECEMLGVVFSILHFKHFTFGRKVHIIETFHFGEFIGSQNVGLRSLLEFAWNK